MNSLTDFQEPVPPKSHKAIFILTGKKNMAHEHFFPTALALVQKRDNSGKFHKDGGF